MSPDRILFTTACADGELYDYVRVYTPSPLRATLTRDISFGLRFIKQNVPSIEVLEYPTAQQFREALRKGWDAVGFSFYTNETQRVLQMMEWARAAGVREIWGGNYGVLNDRIQDRFDRRFIGYAEPELQTLLGLPHEEIVHPPLVAHIGWPTPEGHLTAFRLGVLFTTRGCSFKCSFCQSPVFAPKPQPIPLHHLRRVLEFYRAEGVREVLILDENFGNLPEHTDRVIDLLASQGLDWLALTRCDLLSRNFDSWTSRGFAGALLGIESVNQAVLNEIQKKTSVEATRHLISEMNRRNLLTVGFYIIGFEADTAESLESDLRTLARLDLDVTQVCVLTPFPNTPLWSELDTKYGIFEQDWEKYGTGHLVWKHPHLAPREARDIAAGSLRLLQSPRRFFRAMLKWHLHRTAKYGGIPAAIGFNREFVRSNGRGLRTIRERQPLTVFPR